MRPGRVLIELMAALVSVLHALVEHSDDVILSRAFNDHQVFHKEAVFGVPSAVEDA